MKKSIVMLALTVLLLSPLHAMDNKEAIDATSELESIEHNIMLQQELAAQQAFIELQTLLNSLTEALSEQENATELSEHFASLLIIVLQNALALEAQENQPTCPCHDPATTIHKTHDRQDCIDKPASNPQGALPESLNNQQLEKPSTLILTCCAKLATNLATILAAPRNPLVVSQGIASSLASLLDIIRYAIQAHKKETRTYHDSCLKIYNKLSSDLRHHFSPLLETVC